MCPSCAEREFDKMLAETRKDPRNLAYPIPQPSADAREGKHAGDGERAIKVAWRESDGSVHTEREMQAARRRTYKMGL